MGLPFETPGGYSDGDTTPDAGTWADDLAPVDGYSHDPSGEYESADEDDYDDEYDLDFDADTCNEPGLTDQGDQAG